MIFLTNFQVFVFSKVGRLTKKKHHEQVQSPEDSKNLQKKSEKTGRSAPVVDLDEQKSRRR